MESFAITADTLAVMTRVIGHIEIDAGNCRRACTPEIYATEEAYRLVQAGMPFRDAYRKVAEKYARKS